jgi:hypothetical protein
MVWHKKKTAPEIVGGNENNVKSIKIENEPEKGG